MRSLAKPPWVDGPDLVDERDLVGDQSLKLLGMTLPGATKLLVRQRGAAKQPIETHPDLADFFTG